MRILRTLCFATTLLIAGIARATVADDICAPSAPTCVVATDITVTPPASTLDFGVRPLTITGAGSLNSGSGSMVILAGSVVLQAGARLLSAGGDIDITTSGAIQVLTGNTIARIDTSGPEAGGITLDAGGAVQIDGDLRADATATAGSGYIIDVTGATITIGSDARLTSRGGRDGDGDEIALTAEGDIAIAGLLDVSAGVDGGTITLDGDDVILLATGEFNLQSGEEGFGDEVDISALGNVTLSGPIDGSAGGNDEVGGVGALLFIFADGAVTLNSTIELTGGGSDGEGGQVDILAYGNIVQAEAGAIISAPDGSFGSGGDVFLETTAGNITVKDMNVSAASGGRIELTGNEAVSITGALITDGANSRIGVTGCGIDVTPAGSLSAKLAGGMNTFLARGRLMIRGAVTAGTSNRIEFRNPALPPQITVPVVPSTAPILNQSLPPCGPPPPPTTTTTISTSTTTTTSSTTTTTAPPVTTTTTSTTATTAPPVTTTTTSTTATTAPPVTTTTTSTTATTAPPVTTTTSITSTTSPTVTTTTSTSTTTIASTSTTSTSTSTSTSSSAPPTTTTSSSTTSTTLAPPCDPGNPAACSDGNTCTRDSCEAVGCVHTPVTGFDAATCRLGESIETVGVVPEGELGGPQTKNRISRRLDHALRLIEKARTATGRLAIAGPKKARHLIKSIIRDLERGIAKGKINVITGNALLAQVRSALENVEPLVKRR